MNKYKSIILLLAILLSLIYFACDDSGFVNTSPTGLISFAPKNLKQLNPNVDGVYELWLKLDSSGTITYYSLGRFNIDGNGGVVDTAGNPMTFKYQGDTTKLYLASTCLLTVEPRGDNNSEPSSAVLISGNTSVSNDSIYSQLTIKGQEALGSAGSFISMPFFFYPDFVLSTPTSVPQDCTRGLWLCDSAGNSSYPTDARIYSPGWVYQLWLVDNSNPQSPVYYSAGRYKNPSGPDFDGAGPCAGPGTPYSKPGQDWVSASCPGGKPQDINNGNYSVFITLEPAQEQYNSAAFNSPFFLQLYYYQTITSACYRKARIISVASNQNLLPEARVKITYR